MTTQTKRRTLSSGQLTGANNFERGYWRDAKAEDFHLNVKA